MLLGGRFTNVCFSFVRACLNIGSYSASQLRAVRYGASPNSPPHTFTESIQPRNYGSYDEYVRHQRSKVALWRNRREAHWDRITPQFCEHFRRISELQSAVTAVCLGARWGEECAALTSLGILAIGVDLNPDTDNRWVLSGDFHDLQFPDHVFDFAFTNVVDHILQLDTFVSEVHRVLKDQAGYFLMDVYKGYEEKNKFDQWGALYYRTTDDVVRRVVSSLRFTLVREVEAYSPSYRSYLFRKSA